MHFRVQGTSWGFLLLVAIMILATGTALGVVLTPASTPSSLVAVEARRIAVSSQMFDDSRQVGVEPAVSDAVPLMVGDQGRITRTECEPGALLKSGSSPVTIDDRPVVALSGEVPLWRNLDAGDVGDDVRSVQAELARLGFPVKPDGEYGQETRDAVRALFSRIGEKNPDGSLPAKRVLWIPKSTVTIQECKARLGSTEWPEGYATTAQEITSLRIAGEVAGAVPGPRLLQYQDKVAHVSRGVVTDPDFLAGVASSPEYKALASPDGQSQPLMMDYVLADSLQVATVPPAALFGLSDDRGCVSVDSVPHSVRVVASELGQAVIVFDRGDVPPFVDLPSSTVDSARSAGDRKCS